MIYDEEVDETFHTLSILMKPHQRGVRMSFEKLIETLYKKFASLNKRIKRDVIRPIDEFAYFNT